MGFERVALPSQPPGRFHLGFFLRDAKGILIGQQRADDSGQIEVLPDGDPGLLLGVSATTLEGLDQS
jgi:hypothetical protein